MRDTHDIRIQIPEKVNIVLHTLQQAGYEAYIVGGCVRDAILGRMPSDWDVTTNALPADIKRVFRRTVDTGIKHGTVTVLIGRETFEVTTYRIDGEYLDGRHPESVEFTASLDQDLQRRDFTMNAMAYSDEQGLVDLYGGIDDMRAHVIRAVGDPYQRFSEDALRILRAIRFAAQLGWTIEAHTQDAIRDLAPNLQKISAERIQAELTRLLVSDHPEELQNAYDLGVLDQFLPEMRACMECEQNNPHHCDSVGVHTIHAVQAVRSDKVLRLTMLLHDFGKPAMKTTDENGIDHFHGHGRVSAQMASQILRRLKYDNATREMVTTLIEYHDIQLGDTRSQIRHDIVKIGQDAFPLLFEVKRADLAAQSSYMRAEKLQQVDEWEQMYHRILEDGDCLDLKHLAVKGQDLIAAGVKNGRAIGRILNEMLDDVLTTPSHNTREYLMDRYLR